MATILIPVELSEHVLRHKLCKPFQLYILLKSLCPGHMKIPRSDYRTLAGMLKLKAAKTVKNNLKILIDLNWVGYNKKTGYYFIRSLDFIRRELNLTTRTAAQFDLQKILVLQPFLFASVAGFVARQDQKSRRTAGLKRKSPLQAVRSSSEYNRVASTLLANKLDWSISTVHDHKRQAVKARFMDVIHHFDDLGFHSKFKDQYRKAIPEKANRVRVRQDRLQLQQPDEIIPLIRFAKRKKIETVKGN